MKTKTAILDRIQRVKEVTGRRPSELLPLDLGAAFGKVETKEEFLHLIITLDDYKFSKFLFWLKFWVTGEKDPSIWRFDYEREIFKGETDPLKRLKLLLNFYEITVGFELDLEDLEEIFKVQGRQEVEKCLTSYSSFLSSRDWYVERHEEDDIYIFRRKKAVYGKA